MGTTPSQICHLTHSMYVRFFSSWSRDSISWIHLLKGGHLLDFQFNKIILHAMRLLNAIALFCLFVICVSMGVTPKMAVNGLGLRDALHNAD